MSEPTLERSVRNLAGAVVLLASQVTPATETSVMALRQALAVQDDLERADPQE